MRALLLFPLVSLCAAAPAAAQAYRSPLTEDAPRAFQAGPGAGAALRDLWAASTAAREERVACIGGERSTDGASLITRVQPVEVERADSLGAPATSSIARCGPPEWFGTVHTHIARAAGERPFAGFSASDREVMFQWWKRWQTDGTFCVLYSAERAHCAMDGVAAPRWRREQMEMSY